MGNRIDSWVLHSTEFAVFSMLYAKAPKLQNLYTSIRSRPAPPNLLNNLERLIDAVFRRGSQLAYKPKLISRVGRHGSRKSSSERPTQRRRRQVRRRIEHMRVDPEKNIGTRVPLGVAALP